MDQAYQCFCNAISTAAKNCIANGRRNNHLPCWDAECENLYQTFLQYPEGHDTNRAVTALLDKKRKDRWLRLFRTLDFSHSSPVAWSMLNNLTGRSRQSSRQCPVLANAIARNTRVQIGRLFDSSCRICLTFGGLLPQMQ